MDTNMISIHPRQQSLKRDSKYNSEKTVVNQTWVDRIETSSTESFLHECLIQWGIIYCVYWNAVRNESNGNCMLWQRRYLS